MRDDLATFPCQQGLGFLLQPVEPVSDARDVRRRDPLSNTLGLEALVHLDERPKILPGKRADPQFSTLVGLNRDRSENDLRGARHPDRYSKLSSILAFAGIPIRSVGGKALRQRQVVGNTLRWWKARQPSIPFFLIPLVACLITAHVLIRDNHHFRCCKLQQPSTLNLPYHQCTGQPRRRVIEPKSPAQFGRDASSLQPYFPAEAPSRAP
jgi:hypothetical protein